MLSLVNAWVGFGGFSFRGSGSRVKGKKGLKSFGFHRQMPRQVSDMHPISAGLEP